MYYSIDDIRRANERLGHHWFAPSTMRFFSSRVSDPIYPLPDGSALFVSSERPPHGTRRYSLRIAAPDGSVDTVGEMLAYATGRQARKAAEAFARERARNAAMEN